MSNKKEVWVVYYQDYDVYEDIAAYSTEEAAKKKVKRLELKYNHPMYCKLFPKSNKIVQSMFAKYYNQLKVYGKAEFENPSLISTRHMCQLYGPININKYYYVKKIEVIQC